MYILGLSAFYHDSAAALIKDGKVLNAAQEERFTRTKNDSSFPHHAISFLLQEEGLSINDIDHIVFYDKPWVKFERIIESVLNTSPRSLTQFLNAMPSWLGEKLNFRKLIKNKFLILDKNYSDKKILFSEHHFSHAASTFYTSPFEEACVVNIDGVGEWSTLTIYEFKKNSHKLIKQMNYPNSIGILYSAFTYFCGFKINSGEYKLMGLAPYGVDSNERTQFFIRKIKEELVAIYEDGSVKINLKHFKYHYGNRTINEKSWEDIFQLKTKEPDSELTQDYCDFALAAQLVTEEILLKIIGHAKSITNTENLCLSGGVALNCVANSKIRNQNFFNNYWIHPSPGDAGGAVGAALGYFYKDRDYNPSHEFSPYLGPSFSEKEIRISLKKFRLKYVLLDEESLISTVAQNINNDKVVGWFQGALEWGPRALGNRSILANPKSKDMQSKLNLAIKFREGFRPFAPVSTFQDAPKYFENVFDNPYMQYVHQVKGFIPNSTHLTLKERLKNINSPLPAITHLDGTARLQTVTEKQNQKLYKLIKAFEQLSDYAVLINTSFNVRGEPIVNRPDEAIECFLETKMDLLVLENFLIFKDDNVEAAEKFSKRSFELD